MIIGREIEKKLLDEMCVTKESKLIALYGRRRIGKTYLVNHMFSEHRKDCIFFEFTGSYNLDTKSQISLFVEKIYDWFKEEPTKSITTWTEAFIFLKRTINQKIEELTYKGKVVIFIDEIPWIDKQNKAGFLGALGNFWNTHCEVKGNYVVLLCGSNASWIRNKILDDTDGPLYKRITKNIELKPFTLEETKDYLLKEKGFRLDNKSIVEVYMIFGGVAKYLSYLNPKLTIAQNVDKLFFSMSGELYGEYELVFKSLFSDRATLHKSIMDLLCTKQSGYTLTEISAQLDMKIGGTLQTALDELFSCGFILPISKYGHSKNKIFIISDPFCIFYNKFVHSHSKNQISNLREGHWSSVVGSQMYPIWTGFAFETICIVNIELYLKARGIIGVFKGAYYWSYNANSEILNDKGAQIDIIVEYGNGVFDIVECKYYKDEYTITKSYAKDLQNKIEKFSEYGIKSKKKRELKLVMLTTFGCTNNEAFNSLNIAADIKLEDLLS